MGRNHEYTEEQIAYIKKHHSHMSATELGKYCGVGYNVMMTELRRLGLVAPRGGGPWSDLEESKLRQLAKKNKTLAEIADAVGRSEESCQNKARKLGVVINGIPRHWTVEDYETLRQLWGKTQLASIAKQLKRTKQAIISQARKLKLPPCYACSEDILLADFCRDTGISRFSVIETFVPRYNFPIKSEKPGKKRFYYYVDSEHILEWMEKHQELYNASQIPIFYFGEEPEWLSRKRKADYYTETNTQSGKFKATRWSIDEINKLRCLIARDMTYAEIANELGRSEKAVEHKAVRLGYAYKKPRFWRGAEFKHIKEGMKEKSDRELASELGRSWRAVAIHRVSAGLRRKEMNEKKRKADKRYIKRHWLEMTDAEMAEKRGRSERTVREYRLQMGLRRNTTVAQTVATESA